MTPDSLLALHDAGYSAVLDRVGEGRILDLGCGEGFESAKLLGPGRFVIGVDHDNYAVGSARREFGAAGLGVARMDATRLAIQGRSIDWVCSSHVIEHFHSPEAHVAEIARVLSASGRAFFLTPNAPADFENPFHLHLFDPGELSLLIGRHFEEVRITGLDAVQRVKDDLDARRARAAKLLALDIFGIRHRIPSNWYLAAYKRLLPLAYRVMARKGLGGATGITSDDFFVTDHIDATTLVLFAVASGPRTSRPQVIETFPGRPATFLRPTSR